MRHNTKKGFTLVELLVVIAILAILATVSVVGYTSFIEGSAVKVDADFATQLNHFLAAYKVNNKVTINEDNIGQVTADILDLAGVDDIEPQAGQYGYHFYYDFKNEEYVSLHDDVAITGTNSPAAQIAMNVLGLEPQVDGNYKTRIGNCFTAEGRYYLVDTKGDLAEAISDILGFKGTSATDVTALRDEINKLGYAGLTTYVEKTVFVTANGNFSYASDRTYIVLAEDVVEIGNRVNGSKLGKTQFMVNNNEGITIVLPKTVVSVAKGALTVNSTSLATGATIILPENTTAADVEANYEAGFTNHLTTVILAGEEYRIDPDDESKLVKVSDPRVIIPLKLSAVIEEMDLVIKDMNYDEVDTVSGSSYGDNVGYIVWNFGDFEIKASEILNTNGEMNGEVSTDEIVLSIADDLKTYLEVDGATIKFRDVAGDVDEDGAVIGDGVVDNTDYLAFVTYLKTKAGSNKISFNVTANSTYEIVKENDEVVDLVKVEDGDYSNCPSAEIEIRLVMVTSVGKVMLNVDNATPWTPGNSINFSYSGVGEKFEVVVDETSIVYNWDIEATRLDLDHEVTLSYDCLHLTDACCPHSQNKTLTADNLALHNASCLVCTHKAGDASTHTTACCTHTHGSDCVYLHSTESGMFGHGSHSSDCCDHVLKFYNDAHPNATHTHNRGECCTNGWHMKWTGCLGDDYSCCSKMAEIQAYHDANCCSHLNSGYTHTEACYVCTHNHGTDSCTANAESCAYTTFGTSIINQNVITTTSDCAGQKGTLTVVVDNMTWGSVTLAFNDLSQNPTTTNSTLNNPNNVTIGTLNAFKLNELFSVKSSSNPAYTNTYLVAFMSSDLDEGNVNNLSYGVPYGAIPVADLVGLSDSIDLMTMLQKVAENHTVTVPAVGDTVYLALYMKSDDGTWTRTSGDVIVNLVAGKNATSYEEFAEFIATGDVVLLGDIKIPEAGSVDVKKNLYGNCYTFDIRGGRTNSGIITVEGATIRDLKITGDIYHEIPESVSDAWGSAAVTAKNASIINCYISNTRAPLYTSGTVILEDSVLFGGRYANVDIRGGEIILKGTVTLVQKPVDGVIGVGIAAWFNDSVKTITLADKAELIQYNFVNKQNKENLPSVMGVEFTEPFDEIFNKYADQLYVNTKDNNKNTNSYINAGIFATDIHAIDYRVSLTRVNSSDDDTYYAVGDIITVQLGTKNPFGDINASNTDEFTLTFMSDSLRVLNEGLTAVGNKLTIQGKDLAAGVRFEVTKRISYISVLGYSFDPVPFSFRLEAPEKYRTLKLNGDFEGYETLLYTSSADYGSVFGVAADTFHGKGLHYQHVTADVKTPTTHTNRFEEYLKYVMEEDVYNPDIYGFTNGHLVISEIETTDGTLEAPDSAQ